MRRPWSHLERVGLLRPDRLILSALPGVRRREADTAHFSGFRSPRPRLPVVGASGHGPTTIATDLADRVLTITLDRPDRLNAFTVPMQRELCAVFDEVDADPDIRVVVVTGRGRGFCAGADLAVGGDSFDVEAGSPATGAARWCPPGRGRLLTLRIFQCTKPVIAAINGPAVGVGATMTLPMDIRLASESARFGFVFAGAAWCPRRARRGSCPGSSGSTPRWSGRSPVGSSAPGALDRGLVRSIHAPDELLPAAYELAQEIASTTSADVGGDDAADALADARRVPPDGSARVDSPAIASLGRSADVREGVTSFLEKRPPQFTDQVPADLPSGVALVGGTQSVSLATAPGLPGDGEGRPGGSRPPP